MRTSAGILLFRRKDVLEVFLVHPGGPYWHGKEEGAWSVPKGEFTDKEDLLQAAKREFEEETGQPVDGDFIPLKPIQQKAGKIVYTWAVEGDIDAGRIVSNTFRQEYPYKSGKWITVPEVDKAGWFDLKEARKLMNPAQAALLDDLVQKLSP
ncbi:NUDIX domain-containing protein [Flavisolibacter sp. BT320]|nr:NUDIX domain-containing protein [Flavisolibacter longurius]